MSDLHEAVNAANEAATAELRRRGFEPEAVVVHAAIAGAADDPFNYGVASMPERPSLTLARSLRQSAAQIAQQAARGADHDG